MMPVFFIIPARVRRISLHAGREVAVYRTRDGGKSWVGTQNGLPQENALETVLRDGLSADSLQPAGIYFGTRSGKLFGSKDGGESWNAILRACRLWLRETCGRTLTKIRAVLNAGPSRVFVELILRCRLLPR